jgi:AraC-like DNA-binding protein
VSQRPGGPPPPPPAAAVVEAGVHPRGLLRRHEDRVLPVHELIVVQSGVLPIAEDERRFNVSGGEWVLLQAGRRHFGYDDLGPDTWFYWVCFGQDVDGSGSALPRGRRTGRLARPDRLRVLFVHMLEDQQTGILSTLSARNYLQLMLSEILLEPAGVEDQSAGTQLARRAASFIAEHLTEPDLATARIAGALVCNPDYLGRTFRDAFNETPTDYIHRLRIDRACTLFRTSTWSVEQVATDVGFSDVRYFRRIFRRSVGLSPGQFQRLRPSAGRREPQAVDTPSGFRRT